MFTVEVMPRNFQIYDTVYFKDLIVAGINNELGIVPEYLDLIRAETLPYVLFGKGLSLAPQNNLPGMFSALSPKYLESLKFIESDFYVNLNQTCGVMHSSLFASVMNTDKTVSDETRHWGVKCRACYEPLNTTGVICE